MALLFSFLRVCFDSVSPNTSTKAPVVNVTRNKNFKPMEPVNGEMTQLLYSDLHTTLYRFHSKNKTTHTPPSRLEALPFSNQEDNLLCRSTHNLPPSPASFSGCQILQLTVFHVTLKRKHLKLRTYPLFCQNSIQ